MGSIPASPSPDDKKQTTAAPAASQPQLQANLLVLLLTATAAGALAWWLIDGLYDRMFPIPREVAKFYDSAGMTSEQSDAVFAAERTRNFQRGALVFGIFGAATGMLFALAEGLSRRSIRRTLTGAAAGLVVGMLFGAMGGLAGVAVYLQFDNHVKSINWMIATHATNWGIAGIGIGFALGVSTSSLRVAGRSAVAALGAGVVAAFLYPLIAGYFFPVEETDKIIPSGNWNRLVWIMLTSVLMALMIATAGPRGRLAASAQNGIQ